jgi:hypothetical protein
MRFIIATLLVAGAFAVPAQAATTTNADGVRVTRYDTPVERLRGGVCPPLSFCVYADKNFSGREKILPQCQNNRPKSYRLSTYGFTPGISPGGVTSWINQMSLTYSAEFLDMQAQRLLHVNRSGGGHMPAGKNDKAAWVEILCLR